MAVLTAEYKFATCADETRESELIV